MLEYSPYSKNNILVSYFLSKDLQLINRTESKTINKFFLTKNIFYFQSDIKVEHKISNLGLNSDRSKDDKLQR